MTRSAIPDPAEPGLLLRRTYGAFPTGVTVITTRDAQGVAVGLTCSSFNTVSLAPPLISWSVIKGSGRAPAFQDCTHFAVSVLNERQESVARAFAKSSTEGFAATAYYPSASGCPQISGAAAVLDCSVYARYELGDHILFVGAVQGHQSFDAPPLTFCRGRFGQLAA